MPAQIEPTTRIQLCGRLQVEWAGTRIERDLPGRQGRLLFSYLVLNRHRSGTSGRARRRALGRGRARLESRRCWLPPLSRLRRVLGSDAIEGREELRLVLPDDAWIDWEAVGAASPARAPLSTPTTQRRRSTLHGPPSRSPSAACFPASTRRGSTSAAASCTISASRRSSSSPSSARGWEGRSCRAPSALHVPRSRRAVPRIGTRRADRCPSRSREPRRGAPHLRADPASPARGAGGGARPAARRALPAVARRPTGEIALARQSPRRPPPRPRTVPSPDRSRSDSRRRPSPRSSAVREQIQRLASLLDRAATGEGALVLIAGEGGIGKTRLAAELATPRAAAHRCSTAVATRTRRPRSARGSRRSRDTSSPTRRSTSSDAGGRRALSSPD